MCKKVLHKLVHPIGVHNGTGYTAHHSSSCFNPKLDDEWLINNLGLIADYASLSLEATTQWGPKKY